MTIKITSLSLVLVGMLWALTAPASADDNEAWCEGGSNVSADLLIAGCTAVIQSGRAGRENLSAAFSNRCSALTDKGDYDRALADCDQAISIDPDNHLAHSATGVAHYGKDQWDAAIRSFSQAVRLKPNYVSGYFNRSLAHMAKGQYDNTIKDLDQVLRLDPSRAEAYFNRGIVQYWKNTLERAIHDFDATRRLQSDDALALYARGVVKRLKGDSAGGAADRAAAIARDPDVAWAFESYRKGT